MPCDMDCTQSGWNRSDGYDSHLGAAASLPENLSKIFDFTVTESRFIYHGYQPEPRRSNELRRGDLMKREITNRIRFVLDELVPPILRDNRWFMWPFFVAAYGRLSVAEIMEFKTRAYRMNDDEYSEFYSSLGNSMSRRRVTDMNSASIDYIIDAARSRHRDLKTFLDVGSGNGYLLKKLSEEVAFDRVVGVDAAAIQNVGNAFDLFRGVLPRLPFSNKEFDLVTCTHVLEHVLDVEASVRELIRVARKMILIVVPRQRYYYYTLDEHLNFFPTVEPLARQFLPHKATWHLLDGDWAMLIDLSEQDLQRP